jgi:hypothetical protein
VERAVALGTKQMATRLKATMKAVQRHQIARERGRGMGVMGGLALLSGSRARKGR